MPENPWDSSYTDDGSSNQMPYQNPNYDNSQLYFNTPSPDLPLPPKSHYQLYCWLIAIPLSILLPIIICVLGTQYHQTVFASYQKMSCTISSKEIRSVYVSTKNSHYYKYYPDITFVLTLPDGVAHSITGYDGLERTSFRNKSSAQSILDKYTVGSSYDCWYSTYDGSLHATLVLEDFPASANYTHWIFTVSLVCIALLLATTAGIAGYKSVLLNTRGVTTRGRIINYKQYKSKNGIRYRPIIEFYTLSTPSIRKETLGNTQGAMAPRNFYEVPVTYDPYNVSNNRISDRPSRNYHFLYTLSALMSLAAIGGASIYWWLAQGSI